MSRWQRYWFAEGGRYATAIVRIAIATSVLLTLQRLATLSTVHIPGSPDLYRPVGVWMVFGHWVPPDPLITVLWILAVAGTVAMLLGLATRISTAVSFVAAVALTSASFASSATWSHQYNVVFLAQLAFLGARGGDVLSLDALIRHLRKLPPIDMPRSYQWSLRLVQLAVALMFAGAAFHKIMHAHFTLRWALSDNMRHQLLVRFDLAGLPRPAIANWLIDDVWRYRVAAALNLVSQASPILACIFVRRPLVRVLAGGFFVLETIALGLVVDLWNIHWLPLVAVFIDWDRLLAAFRLVPAVTPLAERSWHPPRRIHVWVIVFVVYEVLTSFIPTLDQRLNTYPFSGFPMFANVRAKEPYSEHLPYAVPGDRFELISDKPADDHAQRWIDHMNRRLYLVNDPKLFETRLRNILADTQGRFPELGIKGIRHYFTIFEAPAYPERARFEAHEIGEMGEIDANGVFHAVLGSIDDHSVTLVPNQVETKSVSLVMFVDDDPAGKELEGKRDGNRFETGAIEGNPLYVVAMIEGHPWLVATRKAWKWE